MPVSQLICNRSLCASVLMADELKAFSKAVSKTFVTVSLADVLPAELLTNAEPTGKEDAGTVDSSTLSAEFIAFYFCGRWCAPAADFTLRLRQYYDAVKTAAAVGDGKVSTMEVVLVPCDRYVIWSHRTSAAMPLRLAHRAPHRSFSLSAMLCMGLLRRARPQPS